MANLYIVKNKTHAELLDKRSRLLRKKPELIALQRKIDNRLAKAGSQHNRLTMINDMMMEKFDELNEMLRSFKKAV